MDRHPRGRMGAVVGRGGRRGRGPRTAKASEGHARGHAVVARRQARPVRLLGAGGPHGKGDRLVPRRAIVGPAQGRARRQGPHAGRRLRQALHKVASRPVRRPPMGPGGPRRRLPLHHLPGEAPRWLLPLRHQAHRPQEHRAGLRVEGGRHEGHRRRLPRCRHQAVHLLLPARLAPSRLHGRPPHALHRLSARPSARAARGLRSHRRPVVRRPRPSREGLGRREALPHGPRPPASPDHQ